MTKTVLTRETKSFNIKMSNRKDKNAKQIFFHRGGVPQFSSQRRNLVLGGKRESSNLCWHLGSQHSFTWKVF